MRFRRTRREGATARADWAVLVAAVVLTGVLAAPAIVLGPAPTPSRPSSLPPAQLAPRLGGRLSAGGGEHSFPAAPAFSSASVGVVTRTLFPGYNTSLPGSFVSSVAAWQVGTPTYVPSTNTLWFPQRDVAVPGDPVPTIAPAAVFNLSSGEFDQLVTNLSNASAFVYNPSNGDIYGTIPAENAVEVVNPRTDAVVDSVIPVGNDPTAVAVDSTADLLFVANAGSSNVTVVDTLHNLVEIAGITVGTDPLSLAVDPKDNLVFVANGGTKAVSVLNISDLEGPVSSIKIFYGPADGIAYSPAFGSLVATDPASDYATILNASLGAVVTSVDVGTGILPAVTTANGTEFVVGNASGNDVVVLNAANGAEVGPAIVVGENASELVLAPPTKTVYAWTSLAHVMESLNLTTDVAQSVAPSTLPNLVSVSGLPAANQVYTASTNGSLIFGISSDRLVDSSIMAVAPYPPLSIISDQSNSRLYVGTTDGVYVYTEPTGHLAGTVTSLTGECSQLELDLKDNFVWLWNSVLGVVAVNLTSLNLEISTGLSTGVSVTQGIAVDTSDSEVFVLTTSSSMTVLSSQTGTVLAASVAVGTNVTSIVFDPADDQIYAAGNDLSLIDAVTFALDGGPVPLGVGHRILGEVYDPSRQDVYVGTVGTLPGREGLVTVVDGASASVSGTSLVQIPVGEDPDAFGVVSGTNPGPMGLNSVWIANEQSGTLSIISAPPQISFFAASPSTLDIGHPTVLTVEYSGGAGSMSLSYQGLPTGCSSANTQVLNCTPSSAGVFTVEVTLTDSLGVQAIANTTVTVLPALSLLTTFLTPTFPRVDVGIPLTGTAVASNGLPPYSYTWSTSDGGGATGANISHAFESPGVYVVTAVVQDATGATVDSSTAVVVEPLPTIEFTLHPGNVTDVDFPVSFTTSVYGGTGASQENWTFGDGTLAFGLNVTHAWTRAGVYTVSAQFEDLLGVTANRSVEITVHPSLTATFRSENASSSSPAVVGTPVAFSATVTGGTAPYEVNWSFGDTSMGSGVSVDHTYGSPGIYTVRANLTDAVGATVETNLTVVVSSPSSGGGITSLGGGFGSGLFLGLLLGGIIAAVILFVAGPRKGARPPPSPVPPYVPP